MYALKLANAMLFLSTLSLRRATLAIHTKSREYATFLSTLSLRRATKAVVWQCASRLYFYPRSPCGERPVVDNIVLVPGKFLSTLSLRRATIISQHSEPNSGNFYPRSPCGERLMYALILADAMLFLSTLSLRRATARRASRQQPAGISIHALLAESDAFDVLAVSALLISIHALLAESDTSSTVIVILRKNFYPRSPCGERLASLT